MAINRKIIIIFFILFFLSFPIISVIISIHILVFKLLITISTVYIFSKHIKENFKFITTGIFYIYLYFYLTYWQGSSINLVFYTKIFNYVY